MLEPGKIIRPVMTEVTARRLVEDLYGFKVTNIKELNSYDDKNYKVEVAAEFTNHNVKNLWPDGYVLKVLNSMDTPKEHVAAEHEVQSLLWEAGVWCPQPVLDREGRDLSRQKIFHETEEDTGTDRVPSGEERPFGIHTVRMLTFIAGDIICTYDATPRLLEETGYFLARIRKALNGFSHPALMHHETLWNLIQMPKLADFLYAVEEGPRRQLVQEVLNAFREQVIPNVDKFQKGVIHGDYNEQNLLVKKSRAVDPAAEEQLSVAGILDFGDMAQSYVLFDLAIAIMYMSLCCTTRTEPLRAGGHILTGYLREMQINNDEWQALRVCVAARYCQSLVMGAYSYSLEPGNEYLLVTAGVGWGQFGRLWGTPKEELYREWFSIIRESEPSVSLPDLQDIL